MNHNNNMKAKKILQQSIFFLPFLILLTISLFLMYHAQFITNVYSNHFEKQMLWFGIGILLLFLFHFIPSKKLFQYSFFFYLGNIILLFLVLFIGKDVNGAKAWLDFKYFSFQPSELMKLSLALFLAQRISHKKFYRWRDEFLFLCEVLLYLLVPCVLVFLEPDTGAIIFYALITFILLWNSTIHKRWFILLGIFLVAILSGFIYCYFFQKDLLISFIGTTFFYRVERLLSFGEGMQIENALIAIGSAPIIRFSITQTGIYIPESPTDFSFALTANVFGLAGNLTILICFLLLDWYFLNFLKKRKNKTEKLFTLSFFTIFIVSQLINISMNLGIFPIIGIPLPFVSYGGSSTIVLFLFLGILFSFVSKKAKT